MLGVFSMKKIIIIGVYLMILTAGFSSIMSADKPASVLGDTIYVDDDGGADFTHIQNAIDAANPGDTIFVYAGTYMENLVIDKSLSLTGEDKENTIIEGGGNGPVILSNELVNVSISDFTITNNFMDYGIYTSGGESEEQVSITNNNFCNISRYAILLTGTSCSVVSNNVIYDCNGGIFLRSNSNHNIIDGNTIFNFVKDSSKGYYNKGVLLDSSEHNIISNNEISFSPDVGISMSAPGRITSNNIVRSNKVINCLAGVSLQFAENNQFYENLFLSNDYGCYLNTCQGNVVYQNDFIDNGVQGFEEESTGLNQWYNESLQKGNFWDDYVGSDADSNGIGDSPYDIMGNAGNEDSYPLMVPFNDINFPPSDPSVYGPANGKIEEEYSYSVCSSDFNDDDVYYLINWGDGISTGWKGPYESGVEQSFSHTWFDKGDFTVRVQCKDDGGLLSDWTNLPVTMPKRKEVSLGVFDLFLNLLENFPFLHFIGTVFSV